MVDPLWTNPSDWAWKHGAKSYTLAGLQADPGLCNLVWLALDMSESPKEYDMSKNIIAVHLIVSASDELKMLAATKTLKEFSELDFRKLSISDPGRYLIEVAKKKIRK